MTYGFEFSRAKAFSLDFDFIAIIVACKLRGEGYSGEVVQAHLVQI